MAIQRRASVALKLLDNEVHHPRPSSWANTARNFADTARGVETMRSLPVHLTIEPSFGIDSGTDLSFDAFKVILDQIPELRSLELTRIGEALLNHDFFRMIEYAKARGIRVCVSDSATLLNADAARRLVVLAVDEIHVSLDGATKSTFERIRVGAKWEQVLESVDKLMASRNAMGRAHPDIFFIMVLLKDNLDEVPLLVELAAAMRVRHVRVHGPIDLGSGLATAPDNPLIAETIHCNAAFADARARAARHGIDICLPKTSPVRERCVRPWAQTYVLCDGTVLPCCLYGQKLRRVEITALTGHGNIFQTPFREIWNNENFRRIRRDLKEGTLRGLCEGCPVPRGMF
ncbi:MAG: SPASM domain-containing protein [Deltaproteobacteria bacterium]|nr:SPASM domain-containing protein [Deltaproteobacteria bacterium]